MILIFFPLPEWVKIDFSMGVDAGGWIDKFTEHALNVSPMTPRVFHESAALFLASMAIARRLVLPMPYGDIYPNLYILWLAITTLYRKSTALNFARSCARKSFPHLLAAQDTTPEAFLSDLAGMQPTNLINLPQSDQDTWNQERDFSAQRGVILDELSGLLAGAGKDYNAGLLEAYLRFYDCDPLYTRSTRAQGRVTVKNSYLSVLDASTPAAMFQHFTIERLWSNGWWPRFVILTPSGRPTWQEATAISSEPPEDLITPLRKLYSRLPKAKWPDAHPTTTVLLETGVFDAWKQYNKALSFDLITDDLPAWLHGTFGRMPTQALKVAMILAALDWKDQTAPKIEMHHLARAIEMTEAWRMSAHRAIETTTKTDFNRLQERILRIISKFEPQGASFRDIYKVMKDKKPAEIERALDDMLKAGLVEIIDSSESGKAGRPTMKYRLRRE